jgi:hypothetical protein
MGLCAVPIPLRHSGPMEERRMARNIAIGRIAVGASALLTSKLFALVFAGREGAEDRLARIAGRLFGIREIAIGLATINAIDRKEPVKRLVQLGMMCDVTDFVVVVLGASALPWRGRLLGLGLAGGFAVASGKALPALD